MTQVATPIHGYFIQGVTAGGGVFQAFQCNCSEEAIMERGCNGEEHENGPPVFIPLFDPNRRVESRRVRRELGDKMVNLGSRANRVPATARRF